MTFAQPYWLPAGAAVCGLLLWRFRQFDRKQRADLVRFVSPRLIERLTASVSMRRRRLKQALFTAGVGCLFVALARPQAGFRWEEAHRKGIELLVAVDTSKSMLTRDVKPDRLTRAKLAVKDLVERLDGDSVGLLAFAGDAFLECPITLDYDAFRESLDSLDTGIIPRGGTDIGAAIREAQAVLTGRTDKERVLVLVTDGEDLGGDAVEAAKAAARDGIKIFTVGVGTAAGELIPLADAGGGATFVKDASGQFVKSRLDESTLKQIAEATGGIYEPLGGRNQGLTGIIDRGLDQFTRHDLASRRTRVSLEQFQWPLFAAMLCFAGELLIGTRKRVKQAPAAKKTKPAKAAAQGAGGWSPAGAATAVLLCLSALPAAIHASPGSAEKAYKKGDFDDAVKEYSAALDGRTNQPRLEFNLGSAAYKSGDYGRAATAFQETLHSPEVPVQQSAYYNLGNTQYRVGEAAAKSNPQDTIKSWEQAVQSYDAALQIKPDDSDAKFNRDLVKKKLEQLKKQQEQKQQNQSQNQNQQQSKNQEQQNPSQPKDQNQTKQQQQQQQSGQGQGKKQQEKDQSKPQSPSSEQAKQQQQQKQQAASHADQQNTAKPGNPQPDNPKTAQSEPGKMSKEDAKQLLDSLRADEHNLPPDQSPRGLFRPPDAPPLKDW